MGQLDLKREVKVKGGSQGRGFTCHWILLECLHFLLQACIILLKETFYLLVGLLYGDPHKGF